MLVDDRLLSLVNDGTVAQDLGSTERAELLDLLRSVRDHEERGFGADEGLDLVLSRSQYSPIVAALAAELLQ